MRPTRWTRKRRGTYFGKGGWHVGRYGVMYIHPVTGNGVGAGWNVAKTWRMRREQEERIRVEAEVRRHNEALTRFHDEDPELFWRLARTPPTTRR